MGGCCKKGNREELPPNGAQATELRPTVDNPEARPMNNPRNNQSGQPGHENMIPPASYQNTPNIPHKPAPNYTTPSTPIVAAPQQVQNSAAQVRREVQEFSLRDCLNALNDIRQNPKKYAEVLQKRVIDNLDQRGLNTKTRVMSNEGRTAWLQGKDYLAKKAPMRPFSLSEGLTAAAYLHSVYQAGINQLTHDGPKEMDQRMNEFGEMMAGGMGENIMDRREIDYEMWMLEFIVDDGVPDRGHRENIFSEEYKQIGFGIYRKDERSKYYITLDFASAGYKSHLSKIPADVKSKSGINDFLNYN
jgi:uncharacterized protein YkwD